MRVRGQPITWDGNAIRFRSGLTIDADGSPRAYGPDDSGLDHTANAGHEGNWWGVIVDRDGNPIVQGKTDPCPGMYVSPTTYGRPQFLPTNPRKWLNSETIPYGVIPGPLRRLIKPIIMGCYGVVTNRHNGKRMEILIGDSGPATHLGEGSMALADGLGINSNPRTGGTDEPYLDWLIYPGVPALINGEQFNLQAA